MDTQRTQACTELIKKILEVKSDEEFSRLIAAHMLLGNENLIDSDFLQIMLKTAQEKGLTGNNEVADRLINYAYQLAEALQLPSPEMPPLPPDIAARLNLLLNLLEMIPSYGWNSEPLVYPLINQNQDLLDEEFITVLKHWTTAQLSRLEPKQAEYFAEVVADLGDKFKNIPSTDQTINLEVAIVSYEIATRVFTYELHPEQWARLQSILCSLYTERMQGDQEQNIEIAIQYGEAALKVRIHQSPPECATTRNHLGNAYYVRIRGNKEENLEKAIGYYKAALCGYNWRNSLRYPEKWAETLIKLGKAYGERNKGVHKKNLKFQIRCYEAALQIFIPQAKSSARDLMRWATTTLCLGEAYSRLEKKNQHNLDKAIKYYEVVLEVLSSSSSTQGFLDQQYLLLLWGLTHYQLYSAYYQNVSGDRGNNLEKAIQHCQSILESIKYQDEPELWVATQINLGLAYSDRIYGERAANIELAISSHNAALSVTEYPSRAWANAQWNLGVAYDRRIRGNSAENLEIAIRCLKESQRVFTLQAFPEEWARIQIVLGSVYRRRIQSDLARQELSIGIAYNAEELKRIIQRGRAENLEAAIRCYESALEILTCQTDPKHWAELQDNLGNAYSDRVFGERSDNLEIAIHCFNASLDVFTRQDFPEEWSMAHMNLGLTYFERSLGNKLDNLKQAIHCYLAALEVFTCQAFPYRYIECLFNLGLIYQAAQQFHDAYQVLEQAISTVESLRLAIRSGSAVEEDKQKLAEQFNGLYRRIVEVCLELAKAEPLYYDRAIEFAERSKARNLVELISVKGFYPKPNVYADRSYEQICNELDFFRVQIPVKQRQLEMVSNQRLERIDQKLLDTLQAELDTLLEQQNQLFEKIAAVDSSFKLSQQVPSIAFDEIKNLIDPHTAIVEWYFTKEQIIAFIITHQNPHPVVLKFTGINSRTFWHFSHDYLTTYQFQKNQWLSTLNQKLRQLAQILHLDEILLEIPAICDQLILIPHQFLHSFPLHALPLPDQQDKSLLDHFKRGVRYAPSCQLLQLSQQQYRSAFHHLFAIQNPTDDLDYTNIEVEAIRTSFLSFEVLAGEAANEVAIKMNQNLERAHCCHFSCHGYFDPGSPLNSALVLAESVKSDSLHEQKLEDGYLTLAEIFGLNLKQCRLVTLSACETGMIDPLSLSDEYIGLPSGFLYAGSPSVVSSLWTVNDLSTAFLMIKFYDNLQQQAPIAVALNQAQTWLRDISGWQLKKWVEDRKIPLSQMLRTRWLNRIKDDEQPFQASFYWAAFCAIGQ